MKDIQFKSISPFKKKILRSISDVRFKILFIYNIKVNIYVEGHYTDTREELHFSLPILILDYEEIFYLQSKTRAIQFSGH